MGRDLDAARFAKVLDAQEIGAVRVKNRSIWLKHSRLVSSNMAVCLWNCCFHTDGIGNN